MPFSPFNDALLKFDWAENLNFEFDGRLCAFITGFLLISTDTYSISNLDDWIQQLDGLLLWSEAFSEIQKKMNVKNGIILLFPEQLNFMRIRLI